MRTTDWTPLSGIPVRVSPFLGPPSTPEKCVRIVRHGLADVLAWLGEDVGPGPDDVTDAVMLGGALVVSERAWAAMREANGL